MTPLYVSLPLLAKVLRDSHAVSVGVTCDGNDAAWHKGLCEEEGRATSDLLCNTKGSRDVLKCPLSKLYYGMGKTKRARKKWG